ncbi:MAG: replicative DNA helicase, partial [Parcubacteria group bacterium Greene1014_47]
MIDFAMANGITAEKLIMGGKLPPQNLEAEMSLLGSLMLDKDAIVKVADFLEPRDFYKTGHRIMYEAMLDLFSRSEPIDILSAGARLKEKGKLEQVGGNAYITELVNSVPTAAHVLSYAKIVQKKRILRDLISVSHEIEVMGYNENEDPDVLVDQAEAK